MAEIIPPPPWLPLWRNAYQRNRRERFVQVATVSPEGLPEVRTVVLRGLGEMGEPYFFSDTRSAKGWALAHTPILELHVWWGKHSEQFRLRGPATLVTKDAGEWGQRRLGLWQGQREKGRALFLGSPPGTPLGDASPPREDQLEPPEHFVLILLTPQRVDYLRLGDTQERRIYRLEALSWQGGPVVS